MKASFNLNSELRAQARALAAKPRANPTRQVERGLPSTWLPVYPGRGGLVPGLEGPSNRAMLEAVEHEA